MGGPETGEGRAGAKLGGCAEPLRPGRKTATDYVAGSHCKVTVSC